MVSNIIIELKYSFSGQGYRKVNILPLDYFDSKIEDEIDIDSTPKFLELKDYLPEKSDDYEIMLLINNFKNKRMLKVYEKKWKGNYFSNVQEFFENKFIDSEIILQIKESGKQKSQTVKFYLKDDNFKLITHALYDLINDSSENLI
jgi:hypothetical protein